MKEVKYSCYILDFIISTFLLFLSNLLVKTDVSVIQSQSHREQSACPLGMSVTKGTVAKRFLLIFRIIETHTSPQSAVHYCVGK